MQIGPISFFLSCDRPSVPTLTRVLVPPYYSMVESTASGHLAQMSASIFTLSLTLLADTAFLGPVEAPRAGTTGRFDWIIVHSNYADTE